MEEINDEGDKPNEMKKTVEQEIKIPDTAPEEAFRTLIDYSYLLTDAVDVGTRSSHIMHMQQAYDVIELADKYMYDVERLGLLVTQQAMAEEAVREGTLDA